MAAGFRPCLQPQEPRLLAEAAWLSGVEALFYGLVYPERPFAAASVSGVEWGAEAVPRTCLEAAGRSWANG